MGTKAATIQAKDAKGAENKRDPVQHNAQQMSQAYAVHGIFASVTNPAVVLDGKPGDARPELSFCIRSVFDPFALEYRNRLGSAARHQKGRFVEVGNDG